jgi:uncharacterized membrane protein YdjX (TVP38/TMEM64 family)
VAPDPTPDAATEPLEADLAEPASGSRLWVKLGLVLGLVALVLAAWKLGVFEYAERPEELRDLLRELGPWGYVAYVVAFALLQPIGVPGFALIVVASYVWPPPVAYGLSLLGAMISAIEGFLFARFVARDWVAKKLPARLHKYDRAIAVRAVRAAFGLRILFWMNPFIHALFGISRVRFRQYVLGTFLGYVPTIAIAVWATGGALELLRAQPTWLLAAVVAIVVLVLVARLAGWRRRPTGTS